jgi:hypothetical protein
VFPKDFYIIPEDVYRLGNSESPRLSHVRSRDVDVMTMNDVIVVVANGKGISVFDLEGINEAPFTGWVWKLPASTPLPPGLKLVHDKPHHYSIAPTVNMPVAKYKGMLEELALRARRVLKKQGKVAL